MAYICYFVCFLVLPCGALRNKLESFSQNAVAQEKRQLIASNTSKHHQVIYSYGQDWMVPLHVGSGDRTSLTETLETDFKLTQIHILHLLADNWQQSILLCATLTLLLAGGVFQATRNRDGWSAFFMVLYIGLGVLGYLTTRWISLRHKGLPFVAMSGVFFIEAVKLVCTGCQLLVTRTCDKFKELSFDDVSLLGVPAIMYTVLNAFFYIAISSTSIADYAITLEMQVVFVAICWVVAFGRALSPIRVAACVGIIIGCCVQHSEQWLSSTILTTTWLPVAVALWGAMTSVTCEVVFKRGRTLDINVQNFVLYGYGLTLSALLLLFLSWKSSKSVGLLFAGTGLPEVILLLSIRALQGVAASRILKDIDSLSKTIGSALCGPIAMGLAPFFMEEPVTTQMVFAIAITYVSSFCFWAQPQDANSPASESKKQLTQKL